MISVVGKFSNIIYVHIRYTYIHAYFTRQCLEICNKWIETCRQLTSIFWPNYSPHRWIGGVHEAGYIRKFVHRLTQVRAKRD